VFAFFVDSLHRTIRREPAANQIHGFNESKTAARLQKLFDGKARAPSAGHGRRARGRHHFHWRSRELDHLCQNAAIEQLEQYIAVGLSA
jgi:hypothetical protein